MTTQLNEFGKKVFLQLAKEEKNVVVSPLSIFSALSMLSFGASGATKEEILHALHFGASSDVRLEILLNLFQSAREANILSMANNAFVNPSCTLKEMFVADVKRFFHSEVTAKDFFFSKNQESAKEINKWVEEQTHNKIKDLIPASILDKDTMLVLVSALYFKASWQNAFETAITQEATFHVSPDKQSKVQMMYKRGKKIEYEENEVAKWVRLPYKPNGKEFNAVFILPQQPGQLSDVIPFLFSPDKIMSLSTSEHVLETLAIPKFKIEYGTELKDMLKEIGIKAAFSSKDADLKGIAESEELVVSNVIHKAMIEVDEEGTVAAAATAVAGKRKKRATKKPTVFTFIADQPFFFLLEHTPSQSIIFTAKIHDPSSSSS